MEKLDILERDNFMCVCGKSVYTYGTPQIAHRIPQRKHLIKKYGKEIIHHPANLVSTCSLKCNASVSDTSRWGVIKVLREIQEYEKEGELIDKCLELIHREI